MAFVGFLAGLILLAIFSWDLPSVSSLRHFRPLISSEIYSHEYLKIGEFYKERRTFLPLHRTPPLVLSAFVAAEDSTFFEHRGISLSGIIRAGIKNILAGEVRQGGSTITQQVAKGLLLTPERSLTRKIREALLAFKMEKFLTKEEILEIYLNQVYLGHSAYGVAAAARVYFAKDITDITLPEVALLAGLTRAPSRDNPFSSFTRAKERQKYVLSRLREERQITPEREAEAFGEALQLNLSPNLNLQIAPYFVEHVRRYLMEKYGDALVLGGGLQIFTTVSASASLAATDALRTGVEEVDRHQGYRGALKNIPEVERANFLEELKEENGIGPFRKGEIYQGLVTQVSDKLGLAQVSLGLSTGTIPREAMAWARKPNPEQYWANHLLENPSEALNEGDVIQVRPVGDLKLERKLDLPSGSLLLELFQKPTVQGALVALDPRSGEIRAMVGGYDFEKSEFNRVVQSRRQPGSSFKPIIYSAALDHDYTPASILVDAPIVYDDPTTEFRWRPKNFGGKFYGDTIFRDCLIKSRNVPTIKIVQNLGLDVVIGRARSLGIESPLDRNFSLALGSSGISPLELVTAYSVFAAAGKKVVPLVIQKILDRDGNVLERNGWDDPSFDLIEQAAVAEQQRTLAEAHTKAIEVGKDPKAAPPEGYALSPQTAYIMTHLLKQVIQVGTGIRARAINRPAAGKTGTTNDNFDAWFVGFTPDLLAGVWVGFDEAQTLGAREEGGRVASPVWLSFMQEALSHSPIVDFEVPDGLVFAQIDPKTGKLASERTERAVFEVFREGTEPSETSEEASAHKSPQQFFLQE